MKWPSETLQNLPYFWNTKSQVVFFLIRATLSISLMNALVYVDIGQGIHQGKIKQHEMNKKNYGRQILKYFVRSFHQAKTTYFWRVNPNLGLKIAVCVASVSKIQIVHQCSFNFYFLSLFYFICFDKNFKDKKQLYHTVWWILYWFLLYPWLAMVI